METGIDKPEVVLSDYVIDYTRLNIDQRVLVESEVDGYDFRYTYGLDLVNVKATGEGTNWWAQSVKKCVYSDYVHTDRLGSEVKPGGRWGRGGSKRSGGGGNAHRNLNARTQDTQKLNILSEAAMLIAASRPC